MTAARTAARSTCSSPIDQPKHWDCQVERYREIRVTPAGGQPEVIVEVGDRATVELTRERAIRAFGLLDAPARVDACPGTMGAAQSSESLRDFRATPRTLPPGHRPRRLRVDARPSSCPIQVRHRMLGRGAG